VIGERDGAIAQALAYVDDCLPPNDRRDFEKKMACDPSVGDRVRVWLAQNQAIRAAFGEAEPRVGRSPVSARDFSRRPPDPGAAARFIQERRRAPRAGASAIGGRQGQEACQPSVDFGNGLIGRLRRVGLAALGALLILPASVGPGSHERAAHFADAAIAAYRTVELASSDPKVLERWFAPQFFRPIDVPDLAAAGYALVGGRVTPGAEGPAAFALYVNGEGERIGLMVEPSDSPDIARSIFDSTGDIAAVSIAARAPAALTAVGRKPTSNLVEFARSAGAAPSSR
jgi:anti-sigma factor RsiW